MPPRPQAILFDAVGTLLFPDPPVAEVYFRVGRRFGSQRTRRQIEQRFRHAMARHQGSLETAQQDGATSEAEERRRWAAIVADVFDDLCDTAPVFEALWDHFAQPRHWRLFDDVAEVCSWLSSLKLTLAIASNFDSRLRGICRASELLAEWPLFISSEIGFRKPSPAFFRHVASALCLPAERLLLVGDDVENDYRAARQAGWQAVLIDRSPSATTRQEPCLRDLRHLPQWLDPSH